MNSYKSNDKYKRNTILKRRRKNARKRLFKVIAPIGVLMIVIFSIINIQPKKIDNTIQATKLKQENIKDTDKKLVDKKILDIISFFVAESGLNIVTTLLRMFIFGGVTLYAFLISEHKKPYLIMAGVLLVFFFMHIMACISEGYVSLYEDVTMYIRTIQVPVYVLVFITFFRSYKLSIYHSR